MSCPSCNSNPSSTSGMQAFYGSNCSTLGTACLSDIATMSYQGPNLPCSSVATGTNMQDLIIAFDTKLCAVLGNYTLYNKYCLDDVTPITTEQQFVEKISSYVCTLRDDLDTFTGTTFVDYQQQVTDRFEQLEVPGVTSTCSAVGLDGDDTLQIALGKLSGAICSIHTVHLNFDSVNWGNCFTVTSTPTTLPAALQLLVDQICSIKSDGSAGGVLPTFNNTSTCLPSPGSTDTLEQTVIKIRTRLCQSPVFDINALSWNCVAKPNNNTTDLQAAFAALMSKVDSLSQNLPSFNGDFNVAYANPAQPCQGKVVSLATSPYADRNVAIDIDDTTAGTLLEKLQAGSNVTFDSTTTPGKLIVNAEGGGVSDGKVKAGATDAAADFLINKINGAINNFGITPTITEDTDTDQVIIANTINIELLTSKILEAIANNTNLLNQLCELNRSCPSPCASPTNVLVTYVSGSTSTTTTTTFGS